jgi:SAM-dependent methyltransferase
MSSPWDIFASLRRSQIESGNDLTFSRVFIPLFAELIGSLKPGSILEAGIGTGHLALELHGFSTRYVGVEPSKGMFDTAREVLRDKKVELFNSTLEGLELSSTFELVLGHMCLQTIEDHTAFLMSVKSRLSPKGAYLFSIPHPAFFNDYKKVIPEDQYCYSREWSGMINFAITLDPTSPICSVPYFHRPLSSYMSALANAGLTLTRLYEVFPGADVQLLYGEPWKTPRYLLLGGAVAPDS